MQTLIFLLIIFAITIAGVLLYLNQKSNRFKKLESSICPSCGAEPTQFYDSEKNTTFKIEPVKKELLKNSGCKGRDIKYSCSKCGLVEVHNL